MATSFVMFLYNLYDFCIVVHCADAALMWYGCYLGSTLNFGFVLLLLLLDSVCPVVLAFL